MSCSSEIRRARGLRAPGHLCGALEEHVDTDGHCGLARSAGRVERADDRVFVRCVIDCAVKCGVPGKQAVKRNHRQMAAAGLVIRDGGLIVAARKNDIRLD